MRVTIKDIAEKAGVSKTTVSFALNKPGRISPETREKIEALVKEMGYVPDPVARTLTTKRLGALGLLLPQPIHDALLNPYLCEMIRGIGQACESRELSLAMLPPVRGKIIEAARRSFVDAILTIGVGSDHEVVELLHNRHVPFVTIDGNESDKALNVGIDDAEAAYRLMTHVLAQGHWRIAIFGLKPDIFGTAADHYSLVSNARMLGFDRAFSEAGLCRGENGITATCVDCSRVGGEAAAFALFGQPSPRPTAIVAMADVVALGVYEACFKLGFSIPNDISVIGFDDIPEAALIKPALTTMHQPGVEKGRVAAETVLDILDGKQARHRLLPAELIIRASSARPARDV